MTATARLIPTPQRSGGAGIALASFAVVLLSFVSFAPVVPPLAAASALLLAVASPFCRDPQPLHLSVFTAAFVLIRYLLPSLRPWPYTLLLPLLAYFSIVLIMPRLRASLQWLRRGVLDKDAVVSIVLISMSSAIALFVWVMILTPDFAGYLKNVPAMPVWLFPLAGLAFAAANGAMEEFIYRGLIMQALDSAGGGRWLSIVIQAWLFGAMHYLHGFPNSWWGVAMTFCYGVMLGWLRRRTQGMLAPWLAHVFADLVIFGIVAESVMRTMRPQ